jgi:outer membrane protein assembly factor BamA
MRRNTCIFFGNPCRIFLISSVVAVFVFICVPQKSGAQTQSPASAKIAEVTGEGSHRMTSAQIAAASGLKPGDAVGKDELQAAANRLAQLGIFGAVNYRFETKTDGVHVHFDVKDGSTARVAYDNFPWFNDDELNAAIRQSDPAFDGTAPTEGQLVNEMAKTLEKLLVTRGVYGSVEHSVIDAPDGTGPRVQFSVAGSPVQLGKLAFTDPAAEIMAQVAARLPDVVGKPYSRFTLGLFAVEQIRPAYLQAGHLKITFGTPQAAFPGAAPVGTQKSVTATLPVDPGPVYHFAGVTWAGNSALSSTALNTLLHVALNDIADGMQIQAAWVNVSAAYAHIGYLDANIDPQATFDDASGKVTYAVRINEGPQYKMGELVVTGLSLEAEKRLRAAWAMQAGAIFDQTYFESFRDKLEKPNPAIFGNLPVHYDKEGELLRRDENKKTVDVLLDYQ